MLSPLQPPDRTMVWLTGSFPLSLLKTRAARRARYLSRVLDASFNVLFDGRRRTTHTLVYKYFVVRPCTAGPVLLTCICVAGCTAGCISSPTAACSTERYAAASMHKRLPPPPLPPASRPPAACAPFSSSSTAAWSSCASCRPRQPQTSSSSCRMWKWQRPPGLQQQPRQEQEPRQEQQQVLLSLPAMQLQAVRLTW